MNDDFFPDGIDAIIYHKRGKYPYVNEQDDGCDIFKLLTGLKSSAGAVVLCRGEARSAVFVDGRYKLAAKLAVDSAKFDILDYGFSSITQWIKAKIRAEAVIAYDPRFYSINFVKKLQKSLSNYKFKAIDLQKTTQLFPVGRALKIHRVNRSFSSKKMTDMYNFISDKNLDAYLLCDPCSISWLLNIRDFSSPFTPVVFGYLLIKRNYETVLYLDDIYTEVINPSECPVAVKSEKQLVEDMDKLSSVGMDETETPSHLCPENAFFFNNPCIFPKATKNSVEIEDIRAAARLDSAAIINLLHWIHTIQELQSLTEIQIAEKLIEFRKQNHDYIGESFACISAADEHSAIIHYSPTSESNAPLRNILLLDTGGQYKYGTTDITRTICLHEPSKIEKKFYTLVLKGHIAIASAKFPEGYSMSCLESLARRFLWQHSADYPHSTSHGIGYMSCVHERLSPETGKTDLYAGMIISNEPGYYRDGDFGIRLENMMLVKDAHDNFLTFETLSLVPFDAKFIDKDMLTTEELLWLADYNKKICENMKQVLPYDIFLWLCKYVAKL